MHALTRVLRGSSIFWIKINNLDLLLFEFSTFFNHKKKKTYGVMKLKKKNLKKKGGQKKQIHHDEKRKKKMNTWGEFCRLEEF